MERLYELETRYDERKSFYGKAKVVVEDDGTKTLVSYRTTVAKVSPEGEATVFGTHSQTTLRHIKEFLKQEGFTAESKKQIVEDYRGFENE